MATRQTAVLIRIGQIAEMYGKSLSTLNHYITLELIEPAERAGSGHRLFDPREVGERLVFIDKNQKEGKTLTEIRELIRKRKQSR